MPVQEAAEIDTGSCVVCINLRANSNKKILANYRKMRTAENKTKQNHQQIRQEKRRISVQLHLTFNKSMSQGSKCEVSKQIGVKLIFNSFLHHPMASHSQVCQQWGNAPAGAPSSQCSPQGLGTYFSTAKTAGAAER